jgi:4-diphosphocytidyl-2-C-methyl-D-erythritol kinase
MEAIRRKAYAKINLGLDVIRKREDGYHDVCMIMQTIDLYDKLTIEKTKNRQLTVKTNLSYLPCDQRNLVFRAAALFLEYTKQTSGLHITLSKRIPVAAGLAGGSTDAAAALIGLNDLFHTALSTKELMKLGVTLGADVPYCILMGTALSEGIGEVLTPLKPMPDCSIVLVKPNINVSTKYVYENLRLDSDVIHPDIASMRKSIEANDLLSLTKKMDNILQSVTVQNYPVIERIKEKLIQMGALTALMSGSGPSVFGVFNDSYKAKKAFQYYKNTEPESQVFLTKPYWPTADLI